MSKPGTAEGGCHCGAVRFAVSLPLAPVPALSCNCSMCMMTGFVHVIVTRADLTVMQGSGNLNTYRFGTRAAAHLFCRTCGIKCFYQPRSHPNSWSVNANCLDVPPELAVEPFDGRNWETAKARLDAGKAAL